MAVPPPGVPRPRQPHGPSGVPAALALRAPFDADLTRRTVELVARRWTLQILAELADGPLRRSRLRDRLGGISEKMLTDTLRDLEAGGFVTRAFFEGTPPRVDYELTPHGYGLTRRLAGMVAWILRDIPPDDWLS